MPEGTRQDWKRLASHVVAARLAAGYKDRIALAEVTGISDRTLGKLENGERVSADTLAAVERAVKWQPDSARQILAGGEPIGDAWEDLTEEEFDALLERWMEVRRLRRERAARLRRDSA